MTVSIETTKVSYSGNGVTTVFSYPFRIFEDNDIQAVVTAEGGAATDLVLNTDYSVTGAGNVAGGTVVLTAGSKCPTGSTLTLLRNMELTQDTDYTDGEAFTAESLETVIDKQMMIAQQEKEKNDRSLKIPHGSTVSVSLPAVVPSGLFAWNAAGSAVEFLLSAPPYISIAVSASSYGADISAAITAIGSSNVTLIVDSPITVNDNAVFHANTNVVVQSPGLFVVASGKTLTGLKESRPEWFGVNTTPGTTDMTVAIQAAFDSISTGGTVILNSIYKITSTVDITKQDTHVVMQSKNLYINDIQCTTAGVLMFDVLAPGVIFDGVSMSGDATPSAYGVGATVNAVRVYGSNNIDGDATFINCHFSNFNKVIEQKAKNVTISDTIISNSLYGVYVLGSSEVVAASDFRGLHITDSRFHSLGNTTAAYAVYQATSSDNFKEFLFSGNYIDDSFAGIYISGGHVKIVDNSFLRMRGSGSLVEVDNATVSLSTEVKSMLIADNIMNYNNNTGAGANTGYGITVRGVITGRIENNVITLAGKNAIRAIGANGVVIKNNTIRGCGNDANDDGVLLDADTVACSIIENKISKGSITTDGYAFNILGSGASGTAANCIGGNFITTYGNTRYYNIARSSTNHNIGASPLIINVDDLTSNPFGNADATVQLTQDSTVLRHTATISADRTLTIGDTNVYEGGKFKVIRKSGSTGGPFALLVKNTNGDTLKSLATDTWAEFTWSASVASTGAAYTGWIVTAYGTL